MATLDEMTAELDRRNLAGLNQSQEEATDEAPTLEEMEDELARRQQADQRQQQQQQRGPAEEFTIVDDLVRSAGNVFGVINTVGSSAVAEPLAGWNGIFRLLSSGGNLDAGVSGVRATQDAMTWLPKTEDGQNFLKFVAAPLKKLDDAADWVAVKGGFGNPYAEATIYSTLVGGLSVAGMRVGARVKVNQRVAEVERIAKDLGIDTRPEGFGQSVLDSAEKMSNIERAQNAPALREALAKAERVEAANVERLRVQAAETPAFINVDEAAKFAQRASTELLEEGYDLAKMRSVQDRLGDLANLERRSPAALADRTVSTTGRSSPASSIVDIQTISNRIAKTLETRGKRTVNLPETQIESSALKNLQNKLDDWMDQQYNADMIGGNPEALARWREFNSASKAHKARFKTDKAIKQLMDFDVTASQMHRWLLGASATGSKPNAAAVVNRVKQILGDNHPAIRGLQQDFLFEIAAPLLQKQPNFKQFLSNFDRVIRTNPELVRALDLDNTKLAQLRRFADTAKEIPGSPGVPRVRTGGFDFVQAFAVWMTPHKGARLAKAGLQIKVMKSILRMILGKNRVTQKQILADLANAQLDGPMLPKGSVAAGRIIQGTTLANIVEADRKARGRGEGDPAGILRSR